MTGSAEGARVERGWRPTRAVIDLAAITHNVGRLSDAVGSHVGVCAVVKADGYGHGAVPVARAAVAAGARWLAVALVEEGVELRRGGIDAPVLLLTEPPPAAIDELLDHELTPMVYSQRFIELLDTAARRRRVRVPVHVKVDTGMGRVGAPRGQWPSLLDRLVASEALEVDGIATHLARADEPDPTVTNEQLAEFERFLDDVSREGLRPSWVHAANTAAALVHADARYNLVRAGIGVYGLSPSPDVDAADHDLRPAMSIVSEVAFAKPIRQATPVSYGHRWSAPNDGWLATIPIGYADGVPRSLTNRAEVLIDGRRRGIVGTVTMDQLLAWCDDREPVVGQRVVLLGVDGTERIRAEDWARAADTITYEIATQMTARIPRTYVAGERTEA